MKLTTADRKKLLPQLDRLGEAVEELLLTGLTTASESTTRTLGVTFQEASRLKLLRLSGSLRIANEELGRFTRNDAAFSQQRLVFFLNRAWLLGKGIARAIRAGDEAQLQQLMWTPAVESVAELNLVTLGVVKKVAAGAFVAFEFRLRSVDDGQAYVWSTVFPLKSGMEIPAEGFLHIPQPQKFTGSIFLDRKVVSVRDLAVSRSESPARIQLGPNSTVTSVKSNTGEHDIDWPALFKPTASAAWQAAAQRIADHRPGPFDLAVELQEEIVLGDWEPDEPETSEEAITYPLYDHGVRFDCRISTGIEGKATHKAFQALLKSAAKAPERPPLYGVMHYENCRLVLQPLTLLSDAAPKYITISDESIDRKALLQTLKFV